MEKQAKKGRLILGHQSSRDRAPGASLVRFIFVHSFYPLGVYGSLMKMQGKRVNQEVTNNMRPLELTPFETCQAYLHLTESEAASPRVQQLRDDLRRMCLDHDIILGLFP